MSERRMGPSSRRRSAGVTNATVSPSRLDGVGRSGGRCTRAPRHRAVARQLRRAAAVARLRDGASAGSGRGASACPSCPFRPFDRPASRRTRRRTAARAARRAGPARGTRRSPSRGLATVSGVPSATIRPPRAPPSGPRSTIQSAVLMTSRLCSMTTTVLPVSTSRWRTWRSFSTSAKCRPVVGSSRT